MQKSIFFSPNTAEWVSKTDPFGENKKQTKKQILVGRTNGSSRRKMLPEEQQPANKSLTER